MAENFETTPGQPNTRSGIEVNNDGPVAEPAGYSYPDNAPAIDIGSQLIFAVILGTKKTDRESLRNSHTLKVFIKGVTAQGNSLSSTLTVAVPKGILLQRRVLIPPAVLLALHNGQISLSYELLNSDNTVFKRSNTCTYSINGTLPDLPAPVIVGDYIADLSKAAQIQLHKPEYPASAIEPGATISVLINAQREDGSSFAPQALRFKATADQPISLDVPASVWKEFIDAKSLQIYYEVVNGYTVRKSQVLQTLIGPVKSTLPKPILNPVNKDLYVLTLPGSFKKNESVSMVTTTTGKGSWLTEDITPDADTDKFTYTVPARYIEQNRDQTLTLRFMRTLDGRIQWSDTLTVKVPKKL